MKKTLLAAVAACSLFAAPAFAETIKIGFVTTLTTGGAVIGNDMKKAVELAVETIGGKMGDFDVEIVFGDDEFNPEKGRAATEQLVLQDDVDIVAGYIWSNVLYVLSSSAISSAGLCVATILSKS